MARQRSGPTHGGASKHERVSDKDIVTEPYRPRRSFLKRIGITLTGALGLVLGLVAQKAGADPTDPSDPSEPSNNPRSDWKDNDTESRLADPKLGDYTSGNHQEDGYDYDNDMRRWGGDHKDSDP